MTDSDQDISNKILERFSPIFADGPPPPEDRIDEVPTPRKRDGDKSWHLLAVAYVEDKETAGVSRRQACKDFEDFMKAEHNYHVDRDIVLDAVNSHHGRPFRNTASRNFAAAVLNNDIESAIKWFKHLTSSQRVRWGFE
jgi:hypothetical protein